LPSASEGKDSRAEALCATLLPVKKKKHTLEIVLLISLTSLTTIWGGFAIYCGFYYHALPEADSSLLSHDGVVVSSSKRLYSFVPEKPEILSYVFYPGGKVEAKAYAPFCFALAQKGNPVYLCVMPFNLAFFDSEAASRVIDNHEAERWVIVGHSLGGAFAGSYASAHASKLSGIVFLASYTTQDLSKTNLKEPFDLWERRWRDEPRKVQRKSSKPPFRSPGNHPSRGQSCLIWRLWRAVGRWKGNDYLYRTNSEKR
jgi:hypothetical protein